jgi:glycerate kinase
MSLRVLICPDKFKGTLTAHAAAAAIAKGWRRGRPADSVTLLPMSDGGDGFGVIVSEVLGGKARTIRTVDAAGRPLKAKWWWAPESKTAVIESALIAGLAMLPSGKYHPFDLDTTGLGRVLQAAAKLGARRCLIGIGGSATNDGGFGVARSLGWRFLDREEKEIAKWTGLGALDRLEPPRGPALFKEVIVAVDVQNPLLGARGCSRIYGPQKGLKPADFPLADQALGRLAAVVKRTLGRDVAKTPGAGAAGGLGFGLAAFQHAKLEPGFELFAQQAKLRQTLLKIDLVITGEGSTDKSSLMGKGVGELAALCQRLEIPCVALSGVLNDQARLRKVFAATRSLAPDFVPVEEAKARPAKWLEQLTMETAEEWVG